MSPWTAGSAGPWPWRAGKMSWATLSPWPSPWRYSLGRSGRWAQTQLSAPAALKRWREHCSTPGTPGQAPEMRNGRAPGSADFSRVFSAHGCAVLCTGEIPWGSWGQAATVELRSWGVEGATLDPQDTGHPLAGETAGRMWDIQMRPQEQGLHPENGPQAWISTKLR